MATATKSRKASVNGSHKAKGKKRTKKILDADQLVIRGDDGKPRILLYAGKHKRSKHETGWIDFLDPKGKIAMRLSCEDNWSSIAMYTPEGEVDVSISGGVLGGAVSVKRHLRGEDGDVISEGEVRIHGDGYVHVEGSHPTIEAVDRNGSTIFEAKDEGAIEDYCYRVALCQRTSDFNPEDVWDYPTSEGSNLGMTIKSFINAEATFQEATAMADGYNQGVLDNPEALFAVVIPPGAAASVGGTVWCHGYVFGNYQS